MYDVVIIGGGPAGYVAAIKAAQLGMHVALVEEKRVGGTCLHHGCIPTKTLLQEGQKYQQLLKQLQSYGLEKVAFAHHQVYERKTSFQNQLESGIHTLLSANKVDQVIGRADIIDGRVWVNDRLFESKHIVIATGSKAKTLPLLQQASALVSTDDLLEHYLDANHVVIVGGGVIGVEFANLLAHQNKQVTLIEVAPRLLPQLCAQQSEQIAAHFRKLKIKVLTETSIEQVEGNSLIYSQKGNRGTILFDALIPALGRVAHIPFQQDFATSEQGFLAVDEHYQTSVPSIYAIGDVNGLSMYAHAASAQGIALMEHLANVEQVAPRFVPNCVYTDLELASVGVVEAQLVGQDYQVGFAQWAGNAKHRIEGYDRGYVKVLFQNERLVGAQLCGPKVSEWIAMFANALELQLSWAQMVQTIYPHPSRSEALYEALQDVKKQAIHHLPASKEKPHE